MYKVVYKVPEYPVTVEIKTFPTFKEAMYFANKFTDGMILEIKWYKDKE